MLSVTLVKLLLVLYCRSFMNEIVKAYAQDHFFDVITNVIGLIAALLANYFDDWMDPVGAIIVCKISLPQSFSIFVYIPLFVQLPFNHNTEDSGTCKDVLFVSFAWHNTYTMSGCIIYSLYGMKESHLSNVVVLWVNE